MSRGSWNIYKKVTGSWVSDGTIYIPNDALSLPRISTQAKTKLVDGDNAFVTPSVKYTKEPITLTWYFVTSDFKDKIETYLENQTDLKIVAYNSEEYIGRFISIDSKINVGEEDYPYDLTAVFEFMSL